MTIGVSRNDYMTIEPTHKLSFRKNNAQYVVANSKKGTKYCMANDFKMSLCVGSIEYRAIEDRGIGQ